MRPSPWLVMVLVGALVGLIFAGLSTYDFVQHLDRQVHSVHCSFIPGLGRDASGTSGCQVAMMSPYSSVFRSSVWGGIPISLPAMSVFAFILFFAADLLITRKQDDVRATGFLALATTLPAAASLIMGVISVTELGTTCRLCVAIYFASAACLIGGVVLWRIAARSPQVAARARAPQRAPRGEEPSFVSGEEPPKEEPKKEEVAAAPPASSTSWGFLGAAFAVGVVFVLAPVALYAMSAPKHDRFVGSCDGLARTDDAYGVMVNIGPRGGAPAIEILDPLCPACAAFEQRLEQSGMVAKIDRKAVLFPLDSTCNWMVDSPIHPGACAVSEAVLCAGDKADDVVAWSFEEHEKIRAASAKDPGAAARMVGQRFPELASCVGSPNAKSKLNKSLRWAVANGVQVLTPQLYVNGVKLCDEDVDLGLDYALSAMLVKHDRGELVAKRAPGAPPPTAAPPPPATANVGAPGVPSAKPAPPPAASPSPSPASKPAASPAPAASPSPSPAASPPPAAEPPPPAEPAPAPAPAEPAPPAEGGTP